MPLELYYFLSITAVNILLSWALYLPYRVAHLHFITVANMAISGYSAAWLVMTLHVPFGWALLVGFALGFLVGYIVSLFIGDAPTFAVVIVAAPHGVLPALLLGLDRGLLFVAAVFLTWSR